MSASSSPSASSPAGAPAHLNATGCEIRYEEGKGRCVYAARLIPAQTVVEISPVLLFTAAEYAAHGRHTALDHYTFRWRDGRMALALGLGSLFNHSERPNVSYTLDRATESIRYTIVRAVAPGEELTIFYGPSLWFEPVGGMAEAEAAEAEAEVDDGWGGLAAIGDVESEMETEKDADMVSARAAPTEDDAVDAWAREQAARFAQDDPDAVVPDEDLPFVRLKLTPEDEEEETEDSIRTVQAWAVDIPDAKQITAVLKWLRQSNLDTTLTHLKRIRRSPAGGLTSLLIAPVRTQGDWSSPSPSSSSPPQAPVIPVQYGLSDPYAVPVPAHPALTMSSLKLKSDLWPTVYAPRRKGEVEAWTNGKVRWAWEAVRSMAAAARGAAAAGELPIVVHLPVPYEEEGRAQLDQSLTAHDTRTSADHPLRHAALHLVRKLADHRAAKPSATGTNVPARDANAASSNSTEDAARNGAHYLLTSLTLFLTHEPCIMCSMALLHSRVKEVIYLVPMGATGGCGGAACLPRLEGVNHRFGIARWKMEAPDVSWLRIDEGIDA